MRDATRSPVCVTTRWIWMLALVAGCATVGRMTPLVYAQPPEPWSIPEDLSSGLLDGVGQPLSSGFPVLVTDQLGLVHAFWPQLPRQNDSQAGIMYYSRWDGNSWSIPLDILYSKAMPMRSPSAVVDVTGRIHLAWTVGTPGPIWYSSAPAAEAGSARAWSTPEQATDLSAWGFGLAVDSRGKCHIVFCTGSVDDRCYYSASADGKIWTSAASLYAGCDDCAARAAIDGRERIHVVFGSQSTGGRAMYYMRSEDGGQTWLAAQQLDQVDDRFAENYGPSWGTVITSGQGQVHVIWFGAPAGQRWHRWSDDGGVTWSPAQQISPDQRGLTMPVAPAFDSAGTLHLISMGWRDATGRPSGAFHLTWQNGRWSQPQLMGSRSDWDAEYAAATVARGNRLVAAWTDKKGPKGTFQIYASTLRLDAPEIVPSPVTPDAGATAPADEGAQAEPSRTPGVQAPAGSETPAPPVTALSAAGLGEHTVKSGSLPYLLAVLPPFVLLVLVLLVRASRRRRGG
jgi:hypothetical protein